MSTIVSIYPMSVSYCLYCKFYVFLVIVFNLVFFKFSFVGSFIIYYFAAQRVQENCHLMYASIACLTLKLTLI